MSEVSQRHPADFRFLGFVCWGLMDSFHVSDPPDAKRIYLADLSALVRALLFWGTWQGCAGTGYPLPRGLPRPTFASSPSLS